MVKQKKAAPLGEGWGCWKGDGLSRLEEAEAEPPKVWYAFERTVLVIWVPTHYIHFIYMYVYLKRVNVQHLYAHHVCAIVRTKRLRSPPPSPTLPRHISALYSLSFTRKAMPPMHPFLHQCELCAFGALPNVMKTKHILRKRCMRYGMVCVSVDWWLGG